MTKETVKRLKFVPARFEVVEENTYVYSCPKCGAMKRPEKAPSLLKGSVATPSLVAGIMNAKYVNGMPLARQERTLEDAVDRSSKIGEAVLYTLNQEVYLKRYLEDGHLSIDNTAAERALKNFAIGRRNWLFTKSIRGAQASATVYSITETALLNRLKPYNYLSYVLEKMKDLGAFPSKEAMLELLPWSASLPDDCRSKFKK